MAYIVEIAFDFDDVICAFGDGVRAAVEQEFGVAVPPFTQWNITKVLNPIIGRDWWDGWMRDRPERWVNFPAIQGAVGGIYKLRQDGHYIEVVTAKPEWAEFVIWEWFGLHRPAVNRVTIVDADIPKTEASDAELLVDDKAQNVSEWMADGRSAILFSQSHNMNDVVDAPRVATWGELIELVRMEEAVRL